MVEFAFVAPILFVVVLGLVVVSIIATNYVQLSNAVRDGARAAAICGGSGRSSDTKLPNGASCTDSNLESYVESRLQAVPASINFTVDVLLNGVSTNGMDNCSQGATIEVNANFNQPLYVPLVGKIFSNTSGNARTITADAEATCTQ